MKHIIKKSVEVFLVILAVFSFLMMMAEASSAISQILWTGGCIAVLVASCKCLDKMGYFSEEDEIA